MYSYGNGNGNTLRTSSKTSTEKPETVIGSHCTFTNVENPAGTPILNFFGCSIAYPGQMGFLSMSLEAISIATS